MTSMAELETIRDLLTPGLPAITEGISVVPPDWQWRPTLSLEVVDYGIVLKIAGCDEPFAVVLADELADGLYKARFRPRVLGALALAKVWFASRQEPEADVSIKAGLL